MEPKTVAVFEQFKKPTQSSTVKNLVSLPTRPIATNSRLKRDDKYKRDMYLAFVENALAQKAKVSSICYMSIRQLRLIEGTPVSRA